MREPNKSMQRDMKILAPALESARKYKQQRDVLLEALKFMLDRFENRTENIFSQRLACTKAREAITQVEQS